MSRLTSSRGLSVSNHVIRVALFLTLTFCKQEDTVFE